MPIAQRSVTHVRELDIALRARVHENIALRRMKLRSSDNFCQLLHVDWLDVDDVYKRSVRSCPSIVQYTRTERLIRDVQVPEVYAKVVCRDVSLLVGVYRDGVDVVGVGVGIDFTRDCRNDIVLLYEPR